MGNKSAKGSQPNKQELEFTVSYECESQRSAAVIKQIFHQNLLLPCWINKTQLPYSNNSTTEQTNEQPKQGQGQVIPIFDFQVIDEKTFTFDASAQRLFKLTLEDQRELRRLKIDKDQLPKQFDPKVVQLFEKVQQLWESFTKIIDQHMLPFKKKIEQVSKKSNVGQLKQFKKVKVLLLSYKKDGEVQYFYMLSYHSPYEEKDQEHYKYNTLIRAEDKEPFFFTITVRFQFQPVDKYLYANKGYRLNQSRMINKLKVTVNVAHTYQFAEKLMPFSVKEFYIQNQKFKIEYNSSTRKVVVAYQEPKMKRDFVTLQKHFHLAFQGGGAKGLAYVGAYKAIKELQNQNESNNKGKQVPITSIMGSSAGGIIALAISTGIPEYQLQKICYKMNEIPSQDRFINTEDDGIYKTKKDAAFQNIKKVLYQYGILQETAFDKLKNYLTQQSFEIIQEKLVRYLEVLHPAMGQILKKEAEGYDINNNEGFFSRFKGWWFGKGKSTAKRQKLNLDGLLFHGALMKGQVIHDIAAECLIKYLLKEMYLTPSQFQQQLNQALDPLDEKEFEQQTKCIQCKQLLLCRNCKQCKAQKVLYLLKGHISKGFDLLRLPLQEVKEAFEKRLDSQVTFEHFLAGITNKFILLIERALQQQKLQTSLNVLAINVPFLSPNQSNLQEYFFKRYGSLKGRERGKINQSYATLNSYANTTMLINPSHIDQKALQKSNLTKMSTLQLMSTIFGKQLQCLAVHQVFDKQRGKDRKITTNQLFYALEAAQSIFQTYNYLKKLDPSRNQIKKIEEYNDNYCALKIQVAKIRMKQYYRLNALQLSCTSVDLDSRVLRFFNHKTTPSLPVCKAVQMTGSFPVAFKAQTWQKHWGYYHIYHPEYKSIIDLEGHEFTDGGLLANFPIKYMDNEELRQLYFSHKAVDKLTFLLGFGLDALGPERYELTPKQRESQKQSQGQAAIALQDLVSSFSKLIAVVRVWRVTSSFGKETINWAELSSSILNEIPLLKFGLKIQQAYPNSDRNLNVEAFQGMVFAQQLYDEWRPQQQYQVSKLSQKRAFLQQCLTAFKGRDKSVFKLPAEDYTKLFYEMIQGINNRGQQLIDRMELMRSRYKQHMKWQSPEEDQKQLTSKLINIFYYHLNVDKNNYKAETYTQYYIFMKFIAQNLTDNHQQSAQTNSRPDLIPPLNRLNFKNLYLEQNITEISQHLDFQGYQSDFYATLIDKEQQIIDKEKTCGQSCCICCNKLLCCCCNDFMEPNRQKELRQIGYSGREAALEQLFQEYEETGTWVASQFFNNHFFSQMSIYDLKTSLKRTTQFLYLFIKGRYQGRLQNPRYIKLLAKIIKNNSFETLLADHRDQSERFAKQYQELADIQTMQNVHHTTFRLSFREVIHFLQTQVNDQNPEEPGLCLQQKFYSLVKLYSKQELDRISGQWKQHIIKDDRKVLTFEINEVMSIDPHHESKRILKTDKQEIQGISKKEKRWAQRELDYAYKQEFYRNRVGLLKQLFTSQQAQSDSISPALKQFVFDLLHNRQPNEHHFKGTCSDWQESPKSSQKKPTQAELKDIQNLLLNLLDNEEDSDLPVEQAQKLIRKKHEAWNSFLILIQHNLALVEKVFLDSFLIKAKKGLKQAQEKVINAKRQIKDVRFQSYIINPRVGTEREESTRASRDTYSWADKDGLIICSTYTVHYYLDSKLKALNDKEEASRLRTLNNSYCEDMRMLLNSIQQIYNFLEDIDFAFLESQPEMRMTLKVFQKLINQNQSAKWNFLMNVWLLYYNVGAEFQRKYQRLAKAPVSQINQTTLGEAFIIDIGHVINLIQQLYQVIYRAKKITTEKPSKVDTRTLNAINYTSHIFEQLAFHKFSLPLFQIDWGICEAFNHKATKASCRLILENQERLQVKQGGKKGIRGTHLIFEGINNSSDYIGSLYASIALQLKDRLQQDLQSIKAITCSSFQSVFGILLSLNKPIDQIRTEMFKLRHIVNTFQNTQNIENYYDNLAWINITTFRYAQFLKYLEKETGTLVQRMSDVAKNQEDNLDIRRNFQNIRLVYMNEKQHLMDTYEKILDQAANNIQIIQGKMVPTHFALQISKKYGYDYKCDLNHMHQYSAEGRKAAQAFEYLAKKLIYSFGSLLQGIIANTMAGKSALKVTKDNARIVAKGVLTGRLLTTFRLKQYLTNLLKMERLSPSITLSDFYNVSKRKILLNFTAINVSQARLVFLNKNLMPNMPLWAAVVATSSLPFFNSCFEANKEWEASDMASFYDFFVYDFFKAIQDKDKRITRFHSANIISSLPLELLKNNTISKKIFKCDKQLEGLNQFAIAFEQKTPHSLINVKFEKNFLNIGCKDFWKVLSFKVCPGLWRNCCRGLKRCCCLACCHLGDPHDNEKYIVNYSPFAELAGFLGSGSFSSTLSTLTQSNDNLTLKWYYDKVIRLPIKIGTLDFHQIVEVENLKKYGVNLLSEKAFETIQRSYQITQFFTHDVFGRRSRRSLERVDRDRFKVKMRVQVIQRTHFMSGIKRNYLQISFLNHSQWNQNYYNHFTVEYSVPDSESNDREQHKFKRIKESQIIWLIEESASIELKFYYPLAIKEQTEDKDVDGLKEQYEIRYTHFGMDLSHIIKLLPRRDTYDYEFTFGWRPRDLPSDVYQWNKFGLCFETTLLPTKFNREPLSVSRDEANIRLRIIQFHPKSMEEKIAYQLKDKQIIKPSAYFASIRYPQP